LARRVSAHDGKIRGTLHTFVRDAGRNDETVSRFRVHRDSHGPAELEDSRSTEDAEDLMGCAVVVVEVVDTVAPRTAPVIPQEKPLEGGSHVADYFFQRLRVDEQGERAVREAAVVREHGVENFPQT
jgi:hypothetical protein